MKNILTIIIVIVISGCSNYSSEFELHINTNKDTVLNGEVMNAKIFPSKIDSILPSFHIIFNNDTFPLPFYEEENCAIFSIVGRGSGAKKYHGFVDYMDENGENKRSLFEIEYYVKEELVDSIKH